MVLKILKTLALVEIIVWIATFIITMMHSPDKVVPMWLVIWNTANLLPVFLFLIGNIIWVILKEIWS